MEGGTRLLALTSLCLLLYVVEAGEFCADGNTLSYCEHGCCSFSLNDNCCLDTRAILGIVFGCITIIAAIVAIVLCCCSYKKRQTAVANRPAVTVVQPYYGQAPPGYSAAQPLPPGYGPQYNPNYSMGSPPYGNPSGPTPGAFSYNAPHQNGYATPRPVSKGKRGASGNPFAAAASDAHR